MTNQQLGDALVEARRARGLSLRDVERDTRISTKYLQALEEGRLEVLPAPVYARAFMRTYAQYLGLDAARLVQQLPGARPEPELPPLPDVHREATAPLISPSWAIGGAVVVVLLIAGLFMFWNRGGGNDGTTVVAPPTQQTIGNQGDAPATAEPTEDVGELVIEDGIVPDLEGHQLVVAVSGLTDAGIPYVVLEVENEDVPSGIIFNQTPSAGSLVDQDTVVTIVASR
jgi:transcriptional regulator with XRE-family HTH domain